LAVPDFLVESEDLFFEDELVDFEPEDFDFDLSLIPAAFAPAPIAPVNAPLTAPLAAPLRASVTVSAAASTRPLTALPAFLAGADLAVDFEDPLDDLLDVDDFEPVPAGLAGS
jgi:hypothetical protein